ncbi:Sulfurtransferase [Candidatus Nitrospira nitrosa]|uniref:Sulfurtransferase n=1 Tax=Candidatus Nitrospira nitrosa TaxID=1742972 RepID=A0A0S4LVU9_9BACT|nr:rhodanese-like domain-containing protein [Candidatus Nitrospira nitrosa]CUS39138.1 Sulfurtransferase [Candidatus Nitrospira nitrosa]
MKIISLLAAFSVTALFGVSLTLTFSSSAIAQSVSPSAKQNVESAQKPVKTIGMEEYRKIVDNPGAALIVDVREPQEYAAGHVPGAINIPRGVIDSKIWNYLQKTDMEHPIVLQCQSGRRATLAAQTLGELGFTQTSAVIMNLDEWKTSGNPFVK